MKKFVNALTLTRILATFIIPFLWNNIHPSLLIVFVTLILLTDFFDGMLARKFHVQSLFGAVMDAVADKVLGIVIIIILASTKKLFYISLVLELMITIINFVAAFLGATTKSSFLGRVKMWFLGISIFLGILAIFKEDILSVISLNALYSLIDFLALNIDNILFASIFLTAGTEFMVAIDYLRRILKELKNKNERITYNLKKKEDLAFVLFDTEYCLKHKDEPISKQIFVK